MQVRRSAPIGAEALSSKAGAILPFFTRYLHRTHSHPAMFTVLSIVLSLFCLFLLQLLLDLRRVARDVGFVSL